MKAFEARKQTIPNQYEQILRDINVAVDAGKCVLSVNRGSIFKEVAEMLAEEGFDVAINTAIPGFKVSWENATEDGKKGTITTCDESPVTDLLSYLNGSIFDDDDDATEEDD